MKKLLAIVLVVSLMFGITAVNVYADGNTLQGIIPYDESQETPVEY